VKNFFAHAKNLGEEALIKDHFFYGNNPGEVKEKDQVLYFLRAKLISMVNNTEFANALFGMINLASKEIGLSNLIPQEEYKTVIENIIPFDTVVASLYPTTITKKKGRKEIEKTRKPNPIRQSPLFLSEEMELLSKIVSPIFTDLFSVSKNWTDCVFDSGFSVVKAQIRESICNRWETLQRFAHVTKLRLQAIRRLTGDSKLKKAKVVRDNVIALLKSRAPDPTKVLWDETSHILGKNSIVKLSSIAFKKMINPKEVDRFFLVEAWKRYEVPLKDLLTAEVKKAIAPFAIATFGLEDSVYRVIMLNHTLKELVYKTNYIKAFRPDKLWGNMSQVAGILIHLRKQLAFFEKPSYELDLLVGVAPGIDANREELIKRIYSTLQECADGVANQVTHPGNIKLEESVLADIRGFYKSVKAEFDAFGSRRVWPTL
jgi:hypothetical protein